MPTRPGRLCPQCRAPIATTDRHCPTCWPAWGTSQRSGIKPPRYETVREQVFADQSGLCAWPGCVDLAEELDHVVPLAQGGTHERSNLQGLCADHHREKTIAERRQG